MTGAAFRRRERLYGTELTAFEGVVAICYIAFIHASMQRHVMPKSASPVRLQEDLMRSASLTGSRHHRSAAQQIEYWASLGRQITGFVDPDSLLDVSTGLARLRVEPILAPPISPEAVFAAVEADRDAEMLPEKVSTAAIRYQASRTHPGYLERIVHNGVRTLGTFHGGVFTPSEEEDSA